MKTNHVKHLFLDLEDTIITPVPDGWANADMINVPKVKAFIQEFKPTHVHLFSFAIWHEAELVKFKHATKAMIEQALDIKLSLMPRVDEDILPACCAVLKMSPQAVDFAEMGAFWGKQEAFRLFLRNHFKGVKQHPGLTVEAVLLDDMVINEAFIWPDLGVQGRIMNIDAMPDPTAVQYDEVLRSGLGNQGYTGRGVSERQWNEITDVQFTFKTK